VHALFSAINNLIDSFNKNRLVVTLVTIGAIVAIPQFAAPFLIELACPCEAYYTQDGDGAVRDLANVSLENYAGEDESADEKPTMLPSSKGKAIGYVDSDHLWWSSPSFSREVMLKNNLDRDVLISKVRVILDSLVRDEVPCVSVKTPYAVVRDASTAMVDEEGDVDLVVADEEGLEVIYVDVANTGELDIEGLTLCFSLNHLLDDRSGKEEVLVASKRVGDLKAHSTVRAELVLGKDIPLAGESDTIHSSAVKAGAADDAVVAISDFEFEYIIRGRHIDVGGIDPERKVFHETRTTYVYPDGRSQTHTSLSDMPDTSDGSTLPPTGGMIVVSGVPIESSAPMQVSELPVGVTIAAGEQLALPLLFFPDMSCHGQMRVEFEVTGIDGGQRVFVAKTKEEAFSFAIGSETSRPIDLEVAKEKSLRELLNSEPEFTEFSIPG
jgi:hypothetical protein